MKGDPQMPQISQIRVLFKKERAARKIFRRWVACCHWSYVPCRQCRHDFEALRRIGETQAALTAQGQPPATRIPQ